LNSQPLTWAQQIVWTGQQIVPGSAHYNQAFCCDLFGPLDVDALQSAFEALCKDVDTMRLVFVDTGDQVRQSASGVHPELERVKCADWMQAQDWMQANSLQPFDVAQICTRAALLSIGPDHHVVFFVRHHLVCDGVSVSLTFHALAERYAAAIKGTSLPARDGFLSISDTLTDPSPGTAFDTSSEIPALPLYGRPATPGGTQKVNVPLELGDARLERLNALAAQPDFRAFTPLMAKQQIFSTITAAWLSRISGQGDVAFAMPQHNRVTPAQQSTIGLFMEMLPLVTTVEPDDSFTSLNARVSTAMRDLMVHGGPGTTRVDLLRHRNVILNVYAGRPVDFHGLTSKTQIVPVAESDPSQDINLEFADFDGTGAFTGRMLFDATRFDALMRTRACEHFLALLDAFLADPSANIASVDILSSPERSALADFNAGSEAPQPAGTILDHFAQTLSDQPAVRDAKRGKGAAAGDVIGIHLPRSVETIIAVLAIHKTGAAFVPLEASLAPERIAFILEDTGSSLVITDRDMPNAVQVAQSASQPVTAPAVVVDQDAPAYVIYTSGSTGTPKGVIVGHRELLGYCQMCLDEFPVKPGSSYAFFSAFGFDIMINSLFMPLMSGGEIVVYSEPEQGGDLAILDVFADDAVDFAKTTPSHLRLGILSMRAPLKRLKCTPHSGEAFPADLAGQAQAVLGDHLIMINEYGPTEAVVGAMLHQFDPTRDYAALVSLGKPAPGMRVVVVNHALAHQPIGVPGEMAIGGRLAHGYLNRAELTAEKFVDDPHNPGERLYLTGDLGVFETVDELVYLGRMDDQIKLNGIRLELGEIEHAVCEIPGVDAAVAALKTGQSGAPALVIYAQGNASRDTIATVTQRALPNSVSLSAVISLDKLPLSSNGKIARGKLPEPKKSEWLAKTGGRRAQTPHEIAMAEIWAEVLGLETIGAEDDFYALGGDSLGAVRITHAARAKGYEIAAVDIFRTRTVAGLAGTLKAANPAPRPATRKRFSRMSQDAQAKLASALRQK